MYITRHSNFKDDIVVAVDNKVIYKSEYTSTADMYLTVVTDDFIGDGSTFVNYDNFKLTLDTHTIIPTEVPEDPEEPEVPGAGKTVVEVTLDSYTSNAGYYKNWAKIAVDTVLSDIAEDNLVFRNDEKGSVDIKVTADEKYMFTTGHLQYLAKIRHNELENYGLGTTYDTMHISYDIKVPEGDGATTRNLTFNMLGTTNSGSDNHFNQTTLVVNAVGNNFSVESSGNKPFSGGISKTAAITNGVWQTVNVYTYLNESGTVDVVVTVGEEIIYTGTSEATHLGLYQVEFYSNNDEGTEANGTYYDNFRVALNSSEYVPVYVEPLEEGLVYITKEDSGDVTVYALGYESGSAVLVMAVYDKTTGKLLKNVFTSTTVTDGTISGTVAASEVSTGNIVKGFVFDSMSTMKPIATHSTLEY